MKLRVFIKKSCEGNIASFMHDTMLEVPLFLMVIIFWNYFRHQKLNYRITPGDEVEDMYILLHEVKRQLPCVTAICSGAIASDYQRLRVESVCARLGLVSLAYLWKQDQSLLLHEMVNSIYISYKMDTIHFEFFQ